VKVVGHNAGAIWCVTHWLDFDTYHLGSCMFYHCWWAQYSYSFRLYGGGLRCDSLLCWPGRAYLVLRVCTTG